MATQLYPWLPARRFIRNRFESLDKIGRTRGHVFLGHGTADRFIPFSMGQRLFAAAPEPKVFLPLVGYDHNDGAGPEFYAEVTRFLARPAANVARDEVQPAER